jgi:hypothetical protein
MASGALTMSGVISGSGKGITKNGSETRTLSGSSDNRHTGTTKDRLIDPVRPWRLIARVGRSGEAIQRAQAFSDPPTTGLETLQLAQASFALGLRDSATKLLNRFSLLQTVPRLDFDSCPNRCRWACSCSEA